MPAAPLIYSNREVYFQKAITAPRISQKTVLAKDSFQFVELWLARNRHNEALVFWEQARNFFVASQQLPTNSSPLTSYYCMLNAVKALLKVKNVQYTEAHGVSGDFISSRRNFATEQSEIKGGGILAALSAYLKEPETNKTHTLQDIFGNLPYIHRAFSLTYKDKSELFIALENPAYVRHPSQNKVWFAATVVGLDADRRVLRYIPEDFQIDEGITDKRVLRRKQRVDWMPKQNVADDDRNRAIARLCTYHRKIRLDVVPIYAANTIWYMKRRIAGIPTIDRYGLTLAITAMHRLSELARYDPKGLSAHISGPANWLLTEFIELSPSQFIDEIACEMTGLEFRMPGVRR
ncbi:YaaC family protein [Methylorubrum populi]